jgi:hypothetical protein
MKCSVPLKCSVSLLLALTAAAPASAGQAGPVTISFHAATMTRDPFAGRTSGTFMMTGRFADAGSVTTSYRYAGPNVHGTATLMGAGGIFTIAMRGTLQNVVNGVQNSGGRWRLCSGTGPYKRATGSGLWDTAADFGSAPPGMLLPDLHGAFYGRLAKGSVARRPGTLGVSCSPKARAAADLRAPVH